MAEKGHGISIVQQGINFQNLKFPPLQNKKLFTIATEENFTLNPFKKSPKPFSRTECVFLLVAMM